MIRTLLVDLFVIVLAVGSAQHLGYFRDGHIWLKALPVVVITVTSFYLAGFYERRPQVRGTEWATRFLLALAVISVNLAAVGFALPPVRLPRLVFLHIIGVIAFWWPVSRVMCLQVRLVFQKVVGNRHRNRACGG